jgi:hypothetical protein
MQIQNSQLTVGNSLSVIRRPEPPDWIDESATIEWLHHLRHIPHAHRGAFDQTESQLCSIAALLSAQIADQ